MGEKLLNRLLGGESCALVTDAGMPAISDPGEDIVRQCAAHSVTVCAVPGPSALIGALAMSGLPTQRFCFEGFLSTSGKSRREHLDSLRGEKRTMIFYEAPHKLLRTLHDFLETFGDRDIALAAVARYRDEGSSLKEACRLAAADTGWSKNALYDLAVGK